jgi:hypothetical protein
MDRLDLLRLFWVLAFALLISIAVNVMLLCRFVWTRRTAAGALVMNAGLSVLACLLVFFVLEFVFAFAVRQSDGFGYTLAARLWFHRYWQPVNSHGYRDYERKSFDGRSVLFVVGDSFVVGHGVERIEDRFANRLADLLGPGWEHVVIGGTGWDTSRELEGVRSYAVRPDVIVLSYYLNDIQGAAEKLGFPVPRLVQPPDASVRWLVDRSFFLNWAYWRLYRRSLGDAYWQYLRASLANPAVRAAHERDLQAFVDHAKSLDADLCVVVWPSLARIPESRELSRPAIEFFRGRRVPVVDLGEAFAGRARSALVVNALDAHPNPHAHREAADLIYGTLAQVRRPSR